MAIISGKQSQMSYLGLLLVVYCMFLTGVRFAAGSTNLITGTSTVKSSSTSPSNQTITPVPVTITATPVMSTTLPTSSPTQPGTTSTKAPITPTSTSSGRRFDGASFFGGIVLGAVLVVIFVFAYKWWQTRNKSYHSL